ncbi:MAG TPA: GNAT family N-acetyltransferase [Ktedonobacterales bacterium]|nr:GNAT family N-acetyltransferase [Ktedonobacterales bacterium]
MGDADRLTFASARSLSLATLTAAFNRGFEGYLIPIGQTPDSLLRMLRENDVREDESLAALAPDGAPVGVALLGRRGARAWVAGMGVAPEWRGQGQGAALLARLLDRARELGVQRVTLEVLEDNTPASRLYERMGFQETRPLTIYTGHASLSPTAAWRAITVAQQAPNADVASVAATPPNSGPVTLPAALPDSPAPRRIAVSRALAIFDALHSFAPSWQREQATLAHMATRLTALALVTAGAPGASAASPASRQTGIQAYMLTSRQPRGYTIMDVGSTGATPRERLCDTLTLLRALLAKQSDALLRAINAPQGDPLGDALDALGCPVVAHQREMALTL